jgi:flagellar motor switch protein FliN/FliY
MADVNSLEEKQPETTAPPDDGAAAGGASGAGAPDTTPEYPAFAGMEAKPEAGIEGRQAGDIGLLEDVNLEVTVELGRTRLSIGDLMDLGQGSVIELDKMAGEPVDIRVNGVLVGCGEVIVLEDVFGIRITRLYSKIDRIQAFG